MAREIRRFVRKVNKATLDVYEECKYTAAALGHKEVFENCKQMKYDDVEYIEIVDGADAEELEGEMDGSCIDDMHEYLVLHLVGGRTATFRNSYVDMFLF